VSALLAAVFVASLLGSLHCAGMCGGVLALCFGSGPARGRGAVLVHAAYHGGRLATYSALGAASGALGAAFDLGGAALGVSRAAAVAAGAGMIGYGVLGLLRSAGVRSGCARLPGGAEGALRRGLRRALSRPPLERAAAIGLLTGLLPCGWLYAFVIAAGGTGGPLRGAAAMAVFWSGTLPVMAALGAGLQGLLGPLRRHAPALSASILVAVGAFTVLGRVRAPTLAAIGPAPCEATGDAAPAERIQAIREAGPPCCHDRP
jgi:hypothetical protein